MLQQKEIFDESGNDNGYLTEENWWYNDYNYYDLDAFYPEKYFESDHVAPHIIDIVYNYILDYWRELRNEITFISILELGCAGGWFTEKFEKEGHDVRAIEGSRVGYEKTKARLQYPGITLSRRDLRRPMDLNRHFDVIMCTEVAEHIEPPFAGTLVQTISNHGDFVWFSSEGPEIKNTPHYHHCNEQPQKYWINLFGFFDYKALVLPSNIMNACNGRGQIIFHR